MASQRILKLKIDLKKIDKKRLFVSEKTGATYLDATVFINDEEDQYGNIGMITQDVSKEERQAGVKGAILGNAKDLPGKAPAKAAAAPKAAPKAAAAAEDADDLPF